MSDAEVSMQIPKKCSVFFAWNWFAIIGILAFYLGIQCFDVYTNYVGRMGDGPSPIVQEALNSIWSNGRSLLFLLCFQVAMVVLLHVLLVVAYKCAWRATCLLLPAIDRSLIFWFGFLSFLIVLAITNSLLHPGSSVFRDIDLLLVQDGALVAILVLALLPVFVIFIGCVQFFRQFPILSIIVAVVLMGDAFYGLPVAERHQLSAVSIGRENSPPNVILLGVDSLRSDVLLGADGYQLVPNIAQAAAAAASYPDTVTPLARTYPAWASILTGRAPLRSGARENLYPESEIRLDSSLPLVLRAELGYETSMLYDEQRFANFGAEFGFEHVVGPPQGLRDFLLGSMIDSVASNLFLLVPASRHVFPDQFANRASTAAYMGGRFSAEVGRHLRMLDIKRPQFIAIHFCAAHWPYMPTGLVLKGARWEYESASGAGYYGSLLTADKQYATAIGDLKALGLLENAIVVTLSDHGESIGQIGDEEVLSGRGSAPILPAMGHGMYAYSVAQNQVVLAIQIYRAGLPAIDPGQRAQSATLIDIAPTVLESVGVQYRSDTFDGLSLRRSLLERSHAVERNRFVESAFAPNAFLKGEIQESSVLEEMGNSFEVRDDLRIRLRDDAVPGLLASKQRAIWRGYSVLATRFGSDGSPEFVYLPDYRERRGVVFLASEIRNYEETYDLAKALCAYYGMERHWMRFHCPSSNL